MDQLIRYASELHSASGVANSVVELTSQDDFVMSDLVALIERDPALTARVLAAVNSSRFGLTRQISNMQQAVTLLGQRTLRTVALSFSVVNAVGKGVDERIYRDYWRRSLTTSLVANRLHHYCPDVDGNDAYVAGLLADIGILALAQFASDAYLPVYTQHTHGPELAEAERSAFGFDHAEFGSCLLEVWKFPAPMTTAVAAHHDQQQASTDPLVRVIFAGNLIPDAIWLAEKPAFENAFSCFESYFDFEMPQFIDLALEVNQAVAKEAELFEIGGLHPVDGATLEIIKEGYGLTSSRR